MKSRLSSLRSNYSVASLYLSAQVTKQRLELAWHQHIYHNLLAPSAKQTGSRRREFTLRALLLGLAVSSSIALIITLPIFNSPLSATLLRLACGLIFLFGYYALHQLSRRGFINSTASLIITGFCLATATLLYQLGFEHPLVQLLTVATILLAGVLFGSRATIGVTVGAATMLLITGNLQARGQYIDDQHWLNHHPVFTNAVISALIYLAIGTIVWLACREVEQTLARAELSEQALAAERDNLEQIVAQRTKELKQAQLDWTIELERFAEFGRLSAGLLHDVATPLMAASITIDQVSKSHQTANLLLARKSLERIEQYLSTARHQFQPTKKRQFMVQQELQYIIDLCRPTARQNQVTIQLQAGKDLALTGNPVRFSQLVSNLIINAIESYPTVTVDTITMNRIATVSYHRWRQYAVVTVTDAGCGFSVPQQTAIFEPFISSKKAGNSNMGLGLTLVKHYVEHDFGGYIRIFSKEGKGTCFKLYLPLGSPTID